MIKSHRMCGLGGGWLSSDYSKPDAVDFPPYEKLFASDFRIVERR
jgi:hypothetical protein